MRQKFIFKENLKLDRLVMVVKCLLKEFQKSGPLRLTAKYKFQAMAKQINNFERAWRDRNKWENCFGKAQLL